MMRRSEKLRPADSLLAVTGGLRDQLHQAQFFGEMTQAGAPRRLGVVACHRGAGASTVAYNLASMLRQRTGKPTLLAEANLRHPVLAQRWQLGVAGTMNRVLSDEAPGRGQVEPNAEGLHVWAAEPDTDPLNLLRRGVPRLLHESDPFHQVVVDLPPALDCPEVSVLGPSLDALILVLEVEHTRWQVARLACQQFETAGIKLLGVVLNKKPLHIPAWLYRLL